MADTDKAIARRILLGLVAGVILGVLTLLAAPWIPGLLEGARWLAVNLLDPFGQLFLRLMFFVVIPLIFASLALGVLQLGDVSRLGPLAGRTFLLFFLNMGIAAALGLVMMNLLEPGVHLGEAARAQLISEYGAASAKLAGSAQSSGLTPATVVDMFMPRNIAAAVTGNDRNIIGEMLPLIVFAILFGIAGASLAAERREKLREGLETLMQLMTRIVRLALRLAPYAVPALIYGILVKIGLDILRVLATFTVACIAMLLLHLFGTMSMWLRVWTRWRPREFFSAIRDVLITAFSTSSSMATLPTALAAARGRLGISASTTGFVLPLGTTMNMSGTALYEGCVVLFVAQAFGVDLSIGQQVTLVLLAVLSAVAVAGIPGGALPLIAGLLAAFGLPPDAIGIILGIEGLLGATRTMVNVGSDMVTAAVIDARHPTPVAAETRT